MKKKTRKLLFFSLVPSLLLSSCVIRIIHTSTNTDFSDEEGNTIYKYQKVNETYKKENLTLDNVGIGSGYRYLPSTGDRKILVVPIEFLDSTFDEISLKRLNNTFFGESNQTGWESVSSFYEKSSYGKLKITGEVSSPLRLDQTVNTFSNNYKKNSKNTKTYTDFVLDAALEKLSTSIDLSQYDTNSDGYIDAVWLVYSAKYNRTDSSSPFWAYTTWETSPKTIDSEKGLKGCLYSWASIDFVTEKQYPSSFLFDSSNVENGDAHTYIHETGHMLGLDDYYSYDYSSVERNYDTPVGGIDMMDMNIGDHDSFSKYLLGWIDPLVITEEYLKSNDYELTLNSLADTSSTRNKAFLLPCNTENGIRYNGTSFDEYLLIEYSTNTDLNEKDSLSKYANGLRGYTNLVFSSIMSMPESEGCFRIVKAIRSGMVQSMTDFRIMIRLGEGNSFISMSITIRGRIAMTRILSIRRVDSIAEGFFLFFRQADRGRVIAVRIILRILLCIQPVGALW